MPESLGSQGIVLVPAILFHFSQLISGSFLAVKWTPKKIDDIEKKGEFEDKKEKEIELQTMETSKE